MYLFIFAGGIARQVHDNITVADLLAVKQKSLVIFTVKDDKFVKLVVDKDKLCPVPIPESQVIKNEEVRFHHP